MAHDNTTPMKRKKFNSEEDLYLLRQVSCDLPFKAKRGEVTAAWQVVADTLLEIDGFNRPNCNWKITQSRFLTLLEEHRSFDSESNRKSGITEDEDEKIILLDDLLASYDDHEKMKAKRKEDQNDKAALEEFCGQTIRENALNNLVKRQKVTKDAADQTLSKDAKLEKYISELKSDNEREIALRNEELQFQKFKFEMEMKDRAEERNQRMLLAQIEQEKMLQLLKTIIESKK